MFGDNKLTIFLLAAILIVSCPEGWQYSLRCCDDGSYNMNCTDNNLKTGANWNACKNPDGTCPAVRNCHLCCECNPPPSPPPCPCQDACICETARDCVASLALSPQERFVFEREFKNKIPGLFPPSVVKTPNPLLASLQFFGNFFKNFLNWVNNLISGIKGERADLFFGRK